MSDTGKQSPLGVNLMSGLVQNKGLCINKVGVGYMGTSHDIASYTFGTLVQNTVLRMLTWAINDAYGRGVVNGGTYQNLISVGEYLDWYPVSNGAWGSFMNSYAIWTNGQTDTSTYTYTTGVNFPATGLYTFNYAADNVMTVTLDGNAIGPASDTFTGSDSVTINVVAGDHIIAMAITNTGGPAGGAVQIIKPIGGELWNSRSYLAQGGSAINNPPVSGTGGGYAYNPDGSSTGGAYAPRVGMAITTVDLGSTGYTYHFTDGTSVFIADSQSSLADLQQSLVKDQGNIYLTSIINKTKALGSGDGTTISPNEPNVSIQVNDAVVTWPNSYNPTWTINGPMTDSHLILGISGPHQFGDSNFQSVPGNTPSGSVAVDIASKIPNPATNPNAQTDSNGKYVLSGTAMYIQYTTGSGPSIKVDTIASGAGSVKIYAPNGEGANTTPNFVTGPTEGPVISLTANPGTTLHADGSSTLTVTWNITNAKSATISDTFGHSSSELSGSYSYGPYSQGTTGSATITVNAVGTDGTPASKSINLTLG